jgi:hypothetical protein
MPSTTAGTTPNSGRRAELRRRAQATRPNLLSRPATAAGFHSVKRLDGIGIDGDNHPVVHDRPL